MMDRALAVSSHSSSHAPWPQPRRCPLPNMAADQQLLVRRRDDLRARMEALHGKRDPWGLSVYEIQAELLGLGAPVRSAQRLPGNVLASLSAEAYRAAADGPRQVRRTRRL